MMEILASLPMLAEMNSGQIRLGILVGYLALLLFLGVVANRFFTGTKNDFWNASHGIGPFLLLMSMFGTTMTAFALVGSTSYAYQRGIGVYALMASSSGIVHSLCFFLVGVKIYQFGRKYKYATQVQFFRDRLESDFAGLLIFPVLVVLVLPYLLLGIIAGGGTIAAMTGGAFEPGGMIPDNGGIPFWMGSLLICLVVLSYVFLGGMRGTTWANAFQTTVFMVLGIVTFYLLTMNLGGKESLMASMDSLTKNLDTEFSTRQSMPHTLYMSYMLIPLSVAMFPHLFQHWLTAKNAKAFKVPVILHPIFVMLVWAPCVLIGAWASSVSPSFEQNKVLQTLVATEVGPIMGGLLSAGILAAIMSSLDSQFLCLGTMFTNDVVTHYGGREKFSDRSQLVIARVFICLIVAVAYALAQLGASKSVFNMGIWCFSGFAGLFPIVVAALYWKRLTAAGVISGVLAMLCSWLYLFSQSNWGANKEFMIYLWRNEYPVMPVTVILLCSALATILTSLLTRPPSQQTLQKFFPDRAKS